MNSTKWYLFGIVALLFSCEKDNEIVSKLPPGVSNPFTGNYEILGEATWPDIYTDDRPDYEIDYDLGISGQLNIDPGVKIVFHKNANAYQGATSFIVKGVIKAKGTVDKPIIFEGDNTDYGLNAISVISEVPIENEFTYCIFDAKKLQPIDVPAGSLPRVTGLLDFEPWDVKKTVNAKIENCQFIGGVLGIRVGAGVNLTSFTNNTITKNLFQPYSALFNIKVIDKVDATNSFLGNSSKSIGLASFNNSDIQYVDTDVTIHNLNADYLVDASIGGGGGGGIIFRDGNLTIESGVNLIFTTYGSLVCLHGHIIAVGTSSERIVFKAAIDDQWQWEGVIVNNTDMFKKPGQSRFEYCDFSNGGLNAMGLGAFCLGLFSKEHEYTGSTINEPAFIVRNCLFNGFGISVASNLASFINEDYLSSNTFKN